MKTTKSRKRTVRAWAVITPDGELPENQDEPRFLCVHRTKREARGATLIGEKVVPVTITYPLPTPKKKRV